IFPRPGFVGEKMFGAETDGLIASKPFRENRTQLGKVLIPVGMPRIIRTDCRTKEAVSTTCLHFPVIAEVADHTQVVVCVPSTHGVYGTTIRMINVRLGKAHFTAIPIGIKLQYSPGARSDTEMGVSLQVAWAS